MQFGKTAAVDSVYLETSFLSVLAARPSRDLLIAANQQVSHEWWASSRIAFECVISSEVLREASTGDQNEVAKRLQLVADLRILTLTPEAERIMFALLKTGALPAKAQTDAAHSPSLQRRKSIICSRGISGTSRMRKSSECLSVPH